MAPETLADRAGVPVERLNSLISGEASVTTEDARLLRRVMGQAALKLLKLQAVYDFYRRNDRRPSPRERKALLADLETY
jgi:plasmid maintenance system antidote protein VapI